MPDLTLYDTLAASVRDHVDATALEIEGVGFTYRQLSLLVEHVAGRMAGLCDESPRRVGLLATRSLGAYAGYLAALRLGATVVPLNTRYPVQRNAAASAAARLDLLVVDAAGQADGATLGQDAGLPVLDLAAPPIPGPDQSEEPAPARRQVEHDDAAYLMFTSGSTGHPKGVPVSHRNVRSYLDYVIARYQLAPGCRLSHAFDLTFDLSVYDLFAAWGSGATLVVGRADELLDPVRYVNTHRVTHWFSVPSVVGVAERARMLHPNSMPDLRWSLFCGEQLTLEQARTWHRAAPGSALDNVYGPTELTISCADYRLPARESDWPVTANGTVPIGSVYPHLEYLVVGADGRQAVDGELCVRGPQRFAGYLDPADDTGRFVAWDGQTAVPHVGAVNPASWYRTGDRVSVHDGYLLHLGRMDHQIKISGYRVELGEIEAVMRRDPRVAEAVALTVTSPGGEVEIIGVYTGHPAPARELTASLRAVLPRYMVPRRFVHLSELPLNDNGKVARTRLAQALATASPVNAEATARS